MNIVYINHYAGGMAYGMEYRPFYLAREWTRAGHRVRIIAGSFSHVRSKQPEAPAGHRSRRWLETIQGVEYAWYQTPTYASNGFGRATNIATFLAGVSSDTDRTIQEVGPTVVIASSTYPMDIWVARRMARKAQALLVFELHDLWPLSPIELNGMSRRHPFAKLCGLAEKAAYRDADMVVSMLPMVADYVDGFGFSRERLHIVPNGVSPDDWQGPEAAIDPEIADFIDEQHRSNRLVVCYAGAHGLPNALEVLIDAAGQLRHEPLAFALVGDGLEKERLATRVAAMANDRIRMFGPVPKAQMRALLSSIDIAYVGLVPSSIFRFGIAPNKLLDYMMAGRPILQSIGAGNDPVTEAGCGLTVMPGSPQAVADGLRRLAALTAEQRDEMGRRGRTHVLECHTYPVLAAQFLDALRRGQR